MRLDTTRVASLHAGLARDAMCYVRHLLMEEKEQRRGGRPGPKWVMPDS